MLYLQHLEHKLYTCIALTSLKQITKFKEQSYNDLQLSEGVFLDKSNSIVIWAIFKINLFPIYNNVAVRNGSVFTGNNHNYFLDIQEEVR